MRVPYYIGDPELGPKLENYPCLRAARSSVARRDSGALPTPRSDGWAPQALLRPMGRLSGLGGFGSFRGFGSLGFRIESFKVHRDVICSPH